jgi:hypothetical protein
MCGRISLINSETGVLSLSVEGKIVGDGSALTSVDAETLGGQDSSSFANSIHLHSGDQITSGTISSARLDSDLSDLADGSLTGSKVGTGINAANITTGRLSGVQLPVYTPWDCRWCVGTSSGTNAATVTCSGDRQLVSGFCYTADASCGVFWYRPNGLDGLTAGTYDPVEGTGMYCSFTGSCSGTPNQNKAFALCCDFD